MEASGRSFHLERPSGFPGLNKPEGDSSLNRGRGPDEDTFSESLAGARRSQAAQEVRAKGVSRRHDSHRDADGKPAEANGAGADQRADRKRAEERGWDRHEQRRSAAEARRTSSGQDHPGEALDSASGSHWQGAANPMASSPPRAAAPMGKGNSIAGASGAGTPGGGGASAVPGGAVTQGGFSSAGTPTGGTPTGGTPTGGTSTGGTPTVTGAMHGQGNPQGLAGAGDAARRSGEKAPATEAPGKEAASAESTQRAERGADVLRQIRLTMTGGAREVSLQLRPAELGRIQIKLGVKAGAARAEVLVENNETLELLREHLPELRAALAERGLEAGELNLGLGEGPGDWGAQNSAAGQRPTVPQSLTALLETTNTEHTNWLDPETGVDIYA